LLEVNQAPSFQTDSELDYNVKKTVMLDTFKILGLTKANRTKQLERIQKESDLKKMYRLSTAFWNKIMHEDIT
jgi:hypothetical protein